MDVVVRVAVDRDDGRVYEHGWQSWSPSAAYRLTDAPHRPPSERNRLMGYRPGVIPDPGCFWGEGLLAVDPGGGGEVVVVAAPPGADPLPSISAEVLAGEVVVRANGAVVVQRYPGSLHDALAAWAQAVGRPRGTAAPTVWCSWYHYFGEVTGADVLENLEAIDDYGLPVQVVQVDDGYQREVGDWLQPAARFGPLGPVVSAIRDRGRRAGVWMAPFLATARSRLAREHPDWLLPGIGAGHNWGQPLRALDTTQPGAQRYLRTVFGALRDLGVDYFKVDFLYAGALSGPRHDPALSAQQAYRQAVALIREEIGADAYLVGCGAPLLPSIGLFDAMRVSPDTAVHYEPDQGDLSLPGQRAAMLTGGWRSWQHGRWWVNDPDCLIARPGVQRRQQWARYLASHPGLRSIGDRVRDLDAWGLQVTRQLLGPVEDDRAARGPAG